MWVNQSVTHVGELDQKKHHRAHRDHRGVIVTKKTELDKKRSKEINRFYLKKNFTMRWI